MSQIRDANAISALREIAKRHGGTITPEQIVDEAEKDDRLHKYFTWDNTEAAEKWRIEEAKQLLRFTVELIGTKKNPVRVFVSLSTERGEGYRIVEQAITITSLREQMLQDALNDMESFRERYRRIRELSGVFREMKLAEKAVVRNKKLKKAS